MTREVVTLRISRRELVRAGLRALVLGALAGMVFFLGRRTGRCPSGDLARCDRCPWGEGCDRRPMKQVGGQAFLVGTRGETYSGGRSP